MKSTIKSLIFMTCIVLMAACQKDGDKIYLSGINNAELMASQAKIVLTQETSKELVLSLAWSVDKPQVSDPSVSAPNLVSKTLQVSTSSDFSANVTETLESSDSHAFTGADLNAVAKNLGAVPEKENTVYFRIKASTGNNMTPLYSNVAQVVVTPFTIDMSIGYILDSKQVATGGILYSENSDGEYSGFMGAAGWANFFMKEGDGTIWGNDGVDGTAFLISSESTHWNFWFPGMSGCYFVNLSTEKKVWSSLFIPTLSITGDLTGDMTFDRPNVKWLYSFTADAAGDITLNIAGTGSMYDYSTGTEDASAVATPVGFVADGEKVAFASAASSITVNVPSAGECTLVLDLSDPCNLRAYVEAGATKPDEVIKQFYLLGVDDGIAGSWNFNTSVPLYDEENLAYSCVAYVNSLWGYKIATEADNWDACYALAKDDAVSTSSEGTLVLGGETNIPAPSEGLYFFDISAKALTYKTFNIVDKIYCSGMNDAWTLVELPATATKGVFEGTISISKASEWGFQVILDSGWAYKYGGYEGKLYYKGSNITDDASLAAGDYTFTVDLINATYTLTAK